MNTFGQLLEEFGLLYNITSGHSDRRHRAFGIRETFKFDVELKTFLSRQNEMDSVRVLRHRLARVT